MQIENTKTNLDDLVFTDSTIKQLACFAWRSLPQNASPVAIAALLEAVTTTPDYPPYTAALAIALAHTNDWLGSLRWFERYLEMVPNHIEILCITAEIFLRLGKFEKSLIALKQCLALDPHNQHPSGRRARVLVKKGEKLLTQMAKS